MGEPDWQMKYEELRANFHAFYFCFLALFAVLFYIIFTKRCVCFG